jgi:hypothetical protein
MTGLVTSGISTAYSELGPLALPRLIRFRGEDYGYVKIGTSSTAELPHESDPPGTLYEFNPASGFMLLRDPDEEVGLVTEVVYGSFGLDAWYFDQVVPAGLGPLLLPKEFSLSYGVIFDPQARVGGGDLMTAAEIGPTARIAATTIDMAAAAIHGAR